MIDYELLREIRKEKKLSVKRITQLCNISQSYYYQIEKGEREPSISTLNNICVALGVTVNDLLGYDPLYTGAEKVRISQKPQVVSDEEALKSIAILLNDACVPWAMSINEMRRIRNILKPTIKAIAEDIINNSDYVKRG